MLIPVTHLRMQSKQCVKNHKQPITARKYSKAAEPYILTQIQCMYTIQENSPKVVSLTLILLYLNKLLF